MPQSCLNYLWPFSFSNDFPGQKNLENTTARYPRCSSAAAWRQPWGFGFRVTHLTPHPGPPSVFGNEMWWRFHSTESSPARNLKQKLHETWSRVKKTWEQPSFIEFACCNSFRSHSGEALGRQPCRAQLLLNMPAPQRNVIQIDVIPSPGWNECTRALWFM